MKKFPSLRAHAAGQNLVVAATLALALPLSLLDGCKVGPNYKRPVIQTPGAYRGAVAPDIAPDPTTTSLGDKQWASVFQDPVLQKLIEEALKNNYDVQIAAKRVLEQQAQVGITKSNEYPTLSIGGSYDALGLPSSLLQSLNTNNNGSTNTGNTSNGATHYYSGGLTSSAAWNLDFWGLYRRQTEAARAQLLNTEWGRQTTRATVVMNVANAYFQLRALDAQMAITQQTIEARQQSLDLTNTLEKGGSTSLADVRQAEELYYTAKANVPQIEQQIAQQENSLSLLLGRNPGPILRPEATAQSAGAIPIESQPHPHDVPAGLPSQLLERRPDVRAAEAELIAANAQIGAARAQFFPQLSLTGEGGVSSSQLKGLVNAGNAYYYITGNLAQPIFEGGKLTNNLRYAKAQQQEMLVTYEKTIAGALSDVSTALVTYDKTREFREQQEKQTAAAADAVRLARMRYNGGSTSYLEVLTNDTNLYTAQLTLTQAQQNEADSLVQLYNALGGGWQ
jgi:multidrug efflux system outer membrane protein